MQNWGIDITPKLGYNLGVPQKWGKRPTEKREAPAVLRELEGKRLAENDVQKDHHTADNADIFCKTKGKVFDILHLNTSFLWENYCLST